LALASIYLVTASMNVATTLSNFFLPSIVPGEAPF